MSLIFASNEIFKIVLISLLCSQVYKAEFSEDVKPCADFNNEMVNADSLSLGGEDGGLGLSGVLVINNAIKDNLEVILVEHEG